MARAGVYLTEDCLACAEGRTPTGGLDGGTTTGGGPLIQREAPRDIVEPSAGLPIVTPPPQQPQGNSETPSTGPFVPPTPPRELTTTTPHPWGQWVVVAFIALVALLAVAPDRED